MMSILVYIILLRFNQHQKIAVYYKSMGQWQLRQWSLRKMVNAYLTLPRLGFYSKAEPCKNKTNESVRWVDFRRKGSFPGGLYLISHSSL